MEILDIIILCCFIPAIFTGLKKGLVGQAVAICIIYFGITLSLRFTGAVSNLISSRFDIDSFWLKFISFIIIGGIVAAVFSLIGALIKKILKVTLLGWVDKLLGIVVALFISAIIISTLIFFFNSVNTMTGIIPAEKIAESRFFTPFLNFAETIFPYLGKLF